MSSYELHVGFLAHTDLYHLFPFAEKTDMDDLAVCCQLPHKPHTWRASREDARVSVAPTCTCPSTWLLEATLDKYLRVCALSPATMHANIPSPDGSYYHLIILSPDFISNNLPLSGVTSLYSIAEIKYFWS